MPLSSSLTALKHRYHTDAYEFIFDALRHSQESLQRISPDEETPFEEAEAHISGPELLDGIRQLALNQYGLMARTVFAFWGITCTEDFGRIVFELIDEGRMRKTDRDQLSDFYEVFEFEEALDQNYSPRIEFAPIGK